MPNNLEEMDNSQTDTTFVDRTMKIGKHKQIDQTKEIKTVIRNLPENKCPIPNGFTGEFYKLKSEEKGILPKTGKGNTKKKITGLYLP